MAKTDTHSTELLPLCVCMFVCLCVCVGAGTATAYERAEGSRPSERDYQGRRSNGRGAHHL